MVREVQTFRSRKTVIFLVIAALIVTLYAKSKWDHRYWIPIKTMGSGVARGSINSMEPVELKVYRIGSRYIRETTYEHLVFKIPRAYLLETDDLAGGNQNGVTLYVAWPSGEPMHLAYRRDPRKYPRGKWFNDYFIQVGDGNGGFGYKRIDYRQDMFSFGVKPHKYGLFKSNSTMGYTREYFDSNDPNKANVIISCSVDGLGCSIGFDYQAFNSRIFISEDRLPEWKEYLQQSKSILDKYLVAHNPPTRHFSPDKDGFNLSPSAEWTQDNLNNDNIIEAAKW